MKNLRKNIYWKRLIFVGSAAVVFSLCLTSCKKYLEAKPDQSISTTSTMDDLEAIMNGYNTINAKYPSSSEVASDDFYLATTDYNGLFDALRFYYTWQKAPLAVNDYTFPYQSIEFVNVALESLPKVTGGDAASRNKLAGNAYFVRASYHYAMSQLFAKAYDPATAGTDPGIALRTTADIAVKPVRSSVAETYAFVIAELKRSLPLLPVTADVKYRASKPSAYGMLARVYLSMRDYKNAGLYADSALSIYKTLIDYNTLSTTATLPFKQYNDEVIYDSRSISSTALAQTRARIDTTLFSYYSTSDLRRSIMFKANTNGSYAFKGTYTGVTGNSLFTGIATDELYLIRSEAAVRNGDSQTALNALNALLINRWKKNTYVAISVNDKKQLLDIILKERRKELVFRGLRWTDLRRLNLEADYAKTLTRNIAGMIYELKPNSPAYLFQIDQKAVDIGGLPQNP